jgi:hypothetical protein
MSTPYLSDGHVSASRLPRTESPMSTYFLATTDQARIMFSAPNDVEAMSLARRAAKATGKSIQYIRRYDGTYGRTVA